MEYQCDSCASSFRLPSHLQRHLNSWPLVAGERQCTKKWGLRPDLAAAAAAATAAAQTEAEAAETLPAGPEDTHQPATDREEYDPDMDVLKFVYSASNGRGLPVNDQIMLLEMVQRLRSSAQAGVGQQVIFLICVVQESHKRLAHALVPCHMQFTCTSPHLLRRKLDNLLAEKTQGWLEAEITVTVSVLQFPLMAHPCDKNLN